VNFEQVLDYGRSKGGPALRAMTVHERALALKALARHLLERKDEFYRISAFTGATRADSWVDIEGGIGTLFSFSSIARRELPNEPFIVEGGAERLSAGNTFSARHILTPKRGVSVHINAFNFPCWGMLEKIAPSLIAGVPAVDTLKAVDASGRVVRTPPRGRYWHAQTPQAFPRPLLERAYRRARENGVEGTDDASLVELLGGEVEMVEGSPRNLKVTRPEDLILAERLLEAADEGA